MLLPIAILYDDIGRAKAVRYLRFSAKIANNDKLSLKDYNTITDYQPLDDKIYNTSVVELPVDKLIFNSSAEQQATQTGICFRNLAHISYVDANNKLYRDYAQLILPKGAVHMTEIDKHLGTTSPGSINLMGSSIITAVDYRGKIFRLQADRLRELILLGKLKIGNFCLQRKADQPQFCSSYYVLYTAPILMPSLNTHTIDFDVQAGLTASSSMSREYSLEHTQKDTSVILIPRGVLSIWLCCGREANMPNLKSVFCPSTVLSLHCLFANLEVFQAPDEIGESFTLIANTIKTLTLPKRLYNVDGGTTAFSLEMNTVYLDKICLQYSTISTYSIQIIRAPNLKSIRLPICLLSASTHDITLDILDAPRLRSISFPLQGLYDPSISQAISMALTIGSDDCEVCIDVPLPYLNILIPSNITHSKVVIRHRGIARVQYAFYECLQDAQTGTTSGASVLQTESMLAQDTPYKSYKSPLARHSITLIKS